MAQLFGHEKLQVYQKGIAFAEMRKGLLQGLPRRVSACEHLERATESILVNIAHASSLWSSKERIVYLGQANGSALECAACLDVFLAKELMSVEAASPGKSLLAEIVSILVSMWKTTADRVREDHAPYRTKLGKLFSHEDLDVYQASLLLAAWVERMVVEFSCSADLLAKLDKSTTSVPLNIAEGTGRFTGTDKAKFYEIAYKATVQSAALVDLATLSTSADLSRVDDGKKLLRRIAAMLTSLSKASVRKD
jgi:four helix bundle protein